MTEEGKKARAAYYREYRRKNPDKIRQYKNRYWDRKAVRQRQAEEQQT